MKIIYLNDKSDFGQLDTTEMKVQNKYGTMYGLKDKLELVTNEHIVDYYVFHSENDKMFLCIDSSTQVGAALSAIRTRLTKERGFTFRPEKDKTYIRMTKDQAAGFPKKAKLLISVNVYGVFLQASTTFSFLQFELSDYKVFPLVEFEH
jgi:hypothetical protein